MCIGIPMRVLASADGVADCEGRGRRERVNTMLLGEQSTGAWILAYQGSAVRALSDDEAHQTNQALDALDAALNGDSDFDRFFSDLVGREPVLPTEPKDDA